MTSWIVKTVRPVADKMLNLILGMQDDALVWIGRLDNLFKVIVSGMY